MTDREKPPLRVPIEQYLDIDETGADYDRAWARICAKRALLQPGGGPTSTHSLPVPVGQALHESDELAVSRGRLWRQVRARTRRQRKASVPLLAALWPRGVLLGAGLVAALACLLVLGPKLRSWPATPTPLALVRLDGEPLDVLEAGREPRAIRFSDQSEIRLAPGARVKSLLSSSSRFELLLSRGSAEFSVTPGGPRRWRIEAGAASVEVVGTVFRVERGGDEVRVSVSRGAVLVRGENVPGWAQRISAGQHIAVPAKKPTAQREPTRPSDRTPSVEPTVGEAVAEPVEEQVAAVAEVVPAATANRPAVHVRRARFVPAAPAQLPPARPTPHDAYAALGAAGIAQETARATTVDRLLELADIARLSGHPQDAVAPLTRALEAFQTSGLAGLAAFTLGRVQLDQLGSPKAAAQAFERALALKLPRALLADCYRRMAEAYERAGNAQGKSDAQARFRAAFPPASQGAEPASPNDRGDHAESTP